MLKTALIAVAVVAIAAPAAFAKPTHKKDDATAGADGPGAPIPYDQLAAVDAKMNGGGGAKHHAAKKKAAKEAPAPAPAQ
jgi:hypothetical protein